MSRTKGSLNRKKVKVIVKKYRKRGRPKGKKNKKVIAKVEIDMSNVKTYKFLGYCPKCKAMISNKELASKFIFLCPICDKNNRVSKLKKDLGNIERPKTKKEYLSNTIHSSHFESLPLNDTSIDPDDLKIQE